MGAVLFPLEGEKKVRSVVDLGADGSKEGVAVRALCDQ